MNNWKSSFCARKKKFFEIFVFEIIMHFYEFKGEFTQKIAKNHKFPSQWLILSTKMGSVCYAVLCWEIPDKKWPFCTSVQCTETLVLYLLCPCPCSNVTKKLGQCKYATNKKKQMPPRRLSTLTRGFEFRGQPIKIT